MHFLSTVFCLPVFTMSSGITYLVYFRFSKSPSLFYYLIKCKLFQAKRVLFSEEKGAQVKNCIIGCSSFFLTICWYPWLPISFLAKGGCEHHNGLLRTCPWDLEMGTLGAAGGLAFTWGEGFGVDTLAPRAACGSCC